MRFALAATFLGSAATITFACSSEQFVSAAPHDAGADGSEANDTGALLVVDAGDANASGDAGRFCATVTGNGTSIFCDDFDTSDSFGAWDDVTTDKGKVSRSMLDCVSPPGCFRGSIDFDDGNFTAARLKRKLDPFGSLTVRLDARVRNMKRDDSNIAGVSVIEITNGDYFTWLQFRSTTGGAAPYRLYVAEWRATDGAPDYSESEILDSPTVAADEWVKLTFEMSLGSKTLTVRARDALVYSGALQYAPQTLSNANANIGARNLGNTQATIELDNVVVSAN